MPTNPKQRQSKEPSVSTGRDLFIVTVSASTPDGPIAFGQIAEAGAKILVKYPALFQPLTITYRA